MKEITDLVSAKPGTRSLRTTVPISIVKMLDLTEDDKLAWIVETDGGIKVYVQKEPEVDKS